MLTQLQQGQAAAIDQVQQAAAAHNERTMEHHSSQLSQVLQHFTSSPGGGSGSAFWQTTTEWQQPQQPAALQQPPAALGNDPAAPQPPPGAVDTATPPPWRTDALPGIAQIPITHVLTQLGDRAPVGTEEIGAWLARQTAENQQKQLEEARRVQALQQRVNARANAQQNPQAMAVPTMSPPPMHPQSPVAVARPPAPTLQPQPNPQCAPAATKS